jgi:hypothetical protein
MFQLEKDELIKIPIFKISWTIFQYLNAKKNVIIHDRQIECTNWKWWWIQRIIDNIRKEPKLQKARL